MNIENLKNELKGLEEELQNKQLLLSDSEAELKKLVRELSKKYSRKNASYTTSENDTLAKYSTLIYTLNIDIANLSAQIDAKKEEIANYEKMERLDKEYEQAKKARNEARRIVGKNKGSFKTGVFATLGVVTLAGAIVLLSKNAGKNNNNVSASTRGITNCSSVGNNQNTILVKNEKGELVEVVTTPEPKPFESYGNFTDATNAEQLYERAHWYKETYFNKMGLGNVITEEELVTAMSLFNGKRPVNKEFEIEDFIKYNNAICNAFVFAASTKEDEINGTRKFIPIEYMFIDGSYESKCARELDKVSEEWISAMNNNNNVKFRNKGEEFFKLVRDAYLLPSNTNEHYAVRGLARTASQANLYCYTYAMYTGNGYSYGVSHDVDICGYLCDDYNTKEPVYVSLAQLMATLEFIPMNEWDAVLQRAGISVQEIERIGNTSIENSYPVEMTINSLELLQAEKSKTLGFN